MDVSDRSGNSEPSSSEGADEVRTDGENVPGDGGRSGSNGNGNSRPSGKRNRQRSGSQSSLDLFAPVTGERGTEQEQNKSESESAGNTKREGGSTDSTKGNNVKREGNTTDRTDANTDTSKAIIINELLTKEYGFSKTKNTERTGRGTDALQRNSEQESSG